MKKLWDLVSLFPASDDAAGGAVDTVQDPASEDAPETIDPNDYRRVKADADRREQLLKDAQAKLKKFEDDLEAKRKKELEAKGEFDTLKTDYEKQIEQLKAEREQLAKFKETVEAAQKAQLDGLLEQLSDDEKDILAGDMATQIKQAKHLISLKTRTGNPSPSGQGGKIEPNLNEKRSKALQNRNMATYIETLPVLNTMKE